MIALLLLIPLALTSSLWAQKKLGRKWRTLHQLVFPGVLLIGLHYMLARKAGYGEASWALALAAILIVFRWKPLVQKTQKLLNR